MRAMGDLTTLVTKLYEPPVRPTIAVGKAAGAAAMRDIEPQLQSLQRGGVISGYDLLWMTGELGVRVPTESVAAATDALHGVRGLENAVFELPGFLPRV